MTTANEATINGIRIELIERGQGRPILFLHPATGIAGAGPALDALAVHGRVLAPVHPGFGHSEAPKSFDSVADLAYFYLDFLEAQKLDGVALVGVSFGAWVAAEIAIKSTARLSHLVLANPIGIKVGAREERDIVDMFALTEDEYLALAYHDAKRGKRDYKSMPESEVLAASRNREAIARYAWSPYMHDPKLKGRLHRIKVPTLILWGTSDRLASEAYGRAFCAAIPGARFQRLEHAGHYAHEEQPQAFVEAVAAFIGGSHKGG
ncbi:MAG: alpha/beta fold hydrolase [Xanthobacteraceae bacterium]